MWDLLLDSLGHRETVPAHYQLHHAARPLLRSGRKSGSQKDALGRSRGGFSAKVHLRTNARGLPPHLAQSRDREFNIDPAEDKEHRVRLVSEINSRLACVFSSRCCSSPRRCAWRREQRRSRIESHDNSGFGNFCCVQVEAWRCCVVGARKSTPRSSLLRSSRRTERELQGSIARNCKFT